MREYLEYPSLEEAQKAAEEWASELAVREGCDVEVRTVEEA